jgi:hypothetical protein
MVLECGEALKEIVMLENGGWARQRGMVFMFGSTVIVMKEILRLV